MSVMISLCLCTLLAPFVVSLAVGGIYEVMDQLID